MPRSGLTKRDLAGGGQLAPDAFARAAAHLHAKGPFARSRWQHVALALKTNHLEMAEKSLAAHLARKPEDAEAICLLALTVDRPGRWKEAAQLLKRAVAIAPEFAFARFELVKLLHRLHEFPDALSDCDRLLAQDDRNPLFRQMKARVLASVGEQREALAIRCELAEENPGWAELWIACGDSFRALGSAEESIAAYRRAIAVRPSCGLAWWSLANMKTFRFPADDIAAMQDQLERPEIAEEDRIDLLFALGKAQEDMGHYDRSFENYAKGNAARRARMNHDWAATSSQLVKERALFTPDFFRARRNAGCDKQGPIFVVGRPRSGSTLVEQILASHSAIEGTAELPYIVDLVRELMDRECVAAGVGYPEILGRIGQTAFAAMGEEYLEKTKSHRKLGRPHFIDKSPANYHHIGFIRLILPKAKIIDARRNPAACCLSMFKHNYSNPNFRLNELARVYRDYVELLAHYDRVLPACIHRIISEQLIADPEAEVRRLLEYLELPFEPACLRFYETERTIQTPSSEQVRRPISAEAVDHWRHFEPWLAPLLSALGSVQGAYPQVPEELR